MKPNFALSLSFDGITLLHRAAPGWHVVGEVALDTPDLPAMMTWLRDRAARLDDGPMYCKIVLPNEQLRYLTVDTGSVQDDRRRALVEAALDGATPYALSELAYAWSISGDTTQVAAAARETLAEAEAFAVDHGFQPVAFVAIPPRGAFSGEPMFGMTRAAAGILPPGETVERDLLAIQITGNARFPVPEPRAAAPVPAPAPALTVPESDPRGTDGLPKPAATEVDKTPASGAPVDAAAPADTAKPDANPAPAPEAHAAAKPEPADDAVVAFSARRKDTPAPAAKPDGGAGIAFKGRRTAGANGAAAASGQSLPKARFTPTLPATAEVASGEQPAFASIRARRQDPEGAPPPLSGVRRTANGAALAEGEIRIEDDLPATAPVVRADTSDRESLDPAGAALVASLRPGADAPDEDAGEPVARKRAGGFLSRRKRREEPAPPKARPAAPAPAAPAAPAARPAAAAKADPRQRDRRAAEADRLTVFGARSAQVARRPRYLGLLLTALLILFLAGVAAWASIFMDESIASLLRRNVQTAEQSTTAPVEAIALRSPAEDPVDSAAPLPAAPRVTTPPVADTVAASPEASAAPQDDLALLAPVDEPTAEAEALADGELPGPVIDDVIDDSFARDLSGGDAGMEARYAATGIWPMAPEPGNAGMPETLDDLYVASIDSSVPMLDAVALPQPDAERRDVRPERPADPPPPGTRYQYDSRGLIAARPDGALTPDGVTIYAGRPARIPPERPAETMVDDAPAEPLPELAQTRPRPRPGGLIERNERSELGGHTRSELAALRPRPRPAHPLIDGVTATPGAALPQASDPGSPEGTDTPVAETPAEDEAEPDPFASGTQFAVATSRRPSVRPSGFDRTVAAAQAAAIRPTAVVAPRQVVAPTAPSNASVTRQATVRNAIDLGRINLIGVYGQPSSRRALIRLSDGRYKKVKVGDRIDGGRISAIGDAELSYVKGGRSTVLRMPKG